MRRRGLCIVLSAGIGILGCSSAAQHADGPEEFSPYVSNDGTISIPENYRTEFASLGAWSIAGDEDTGGGQGLHVVYMQRHAVEAYGESGQFPPSRPYTSPYVTSLISSRWPSGS